MLISITLAVIYICVSNTLWKTLNDIRRLWRYGPASLFCVEACVWIKKMLKLLGWLMP
jgi:hypothetical protein